MGKPRKSIPLEWILDGTVPAVELIWIPGVGFDIKTSFLRAGKKSKKNPGRMAAPAKKKGK
jgi:hypothetical protein